MCQFVHLHTHSTYSWDAISSPDKLIKQAISNGQPGMAITDHGNLSGLPDFYFSSKKYDNFKPIGGIEAYVTVNGVRTHLTLLADGERGYNNLVRMNNSGVNRAVTTAEDLRYHPISMYDLETYNDGVIILTGCPSSIMQTKHTSDSEALSILSSLKKTYKDRIFAEVMFNTDSEILGDNVARSLFLAEQANIPIVVTNDVHYARRTDYEAHSFFNKLHHALHYDAKNLWMMSATNMVQAFSGDTTKLLEGMENSVKILNALSPLVFNGKAHLPIINDDEKLLKDTVYNNLQLRFGNHPNYKEYQERAEYELKIILSKGFSAYFLIVSDVVNFAKSNGHSVGVGRGSAAGSLISYLLGITGVDPLEYDLLFERFLNPYRNSMPDIDVDFSQEGREAVINYSSQKYGAVPIVTNSYYSHKSLVRDMGKFFNLPNSVVDYLAEYGTDTEEWQRITGTIPKWQTIYDSLIEETIRHQGQHAGGILIKGDEIEIPTTVNKRGEILAAFSEGLHGQDLTAAGGVKMDFLGITTLGMLEQLQRATGDTPPELKPDEWHDCFNLIMEDKLDGVFQLGGSSARNYARQFNPRNIEDIADVSALARTGAKESGTQDLYLIHRAVKGYPRVRSVPGEMAKLFELTLEDGTKLWYPGNWQIKLADGSWILIEDLKDQEVFEEI